MKKALLIIAIIVLIFSCKKNDTKPEDNTSPIITSNCEIKSFSSNSSAYTYEYTADGKISKIIYVDGSYCEYDYSSNHVKYTSYNKYGARSNYGTATFNNSGYITSDNRTIDPNVNSLYYFYLFNYEYNSNGIMTKMSIKYDNHYSEITYEIANENVVEATQIDSVYSVATKTIDLYTYNNKSNNVNILQWGTKYYGKPCKNQINSISTMVCYTTDTLNYVTNYTYTSDDKGNISTISGVASGDVNRTMFSSIEWTCK